MSDFDRMHKYVKELEQENKMLINQNAQLKEELKNLKSNSEGLDRGLDQSRLVRQLSDYIELIKPSKPRSALTSQRPPTRARHQLETSTGTSQTPAATDTSQGPVGFTRHRYKTPFNRYRLK